MIHRKSLARSAAALALAFVCAGRSAAAVECWTGWGYFVEPGTHVYKSERFLISTAGAVVWRPGQTVALYILDEATGAIRQDLEPISVIPRNPRFSRQEGLPYVNGLAAVVGAPDDLAFGLSHIRPSVAGIERLDRFFRRACGLD